ncbi:potassium channel subfamily K member 1-like [Chiloscyllium plagiosum]|uniref:potassium channel subfamily K member 1-like n=1 Tax=Chiloscyllium plagiosum TaxID=36176 RepID=UPI001CB7BC90|nr:potassium channel subfamily K member 1-like [Chiloscyllium plagiosum]
MAEHRPHCDLKACYFLKLTLCFLVYVLFGTVVFSAVEQPWEVQMRKELVEMKSTFLQQHGCIPEPELDALLHRVITASNYGVSALRNASDDHNWDLASSLFFVSTVLTTIGYGHSVPFTSGGKAFCILYSVLGIPITLLLLTSVVQHLMFYVHWVPITYIHTHWRLAMPVVARIHALVIGSVVAGCFFLIPAAAFTALEEDWDYVSSLYFCFISLSTIGLGDYVPGNSRYPSLRNLYKVGIACYLVIGLVALLVVLESFYELQELQRFIKIIMGHPDKEGQLRITEREVAITSSNLDTTGCEENANEDGKVDRSTKMASEPSPEQ